MPWSVSPAPPLAAVAIPLSSGRSVELQLNPAWAWGAVLIAAIGLLFLSHYTYERGTRRRALLLALRWGAVAVALFALLRPSLVFTRIEKQSSVLVILADKSKSMLLRDMWGGNSRWEAMKKVLVEADGDFQELSQSVQIRRFEFSNNLIETIATEQDPAGEQTAIGDALQELKRRTAGERLAGVILLTDGVNTTGVSPTTIARQELAGIPVYAFGFGQETASEVVRDIAARNIITPPMVFVKNKMPVRAEFATTGFSNRAVAARLLFDGLEKAAGTIDAREGGKGLVELTAVPERAGDVKVTVETAVQEGELLTTNNAVSTYITVLSGGISVLQIEGKYRFWEPKFVRWALDQSPDIELTQLFLLDTSGQKNPVPPDLFTPGRFDVILLGDVRANQFERAQLDAIRDMVMRGAGLMMMGGYDSFGAGGWTDTPIADLLPVLMRPSDGQTTAKWKLEPTPAGLRHFILRLAASDEANRAAWQSLQPLDGGNTWTGLKVNATVLATADGGTPVLAAQEIGAGRSLAFAGDTTWRWRRKKEGIAAHARFWRQLILWLARKDETAGSQVRLRLPQRRLAIGQRLPIEIRIDNGDGTPNTTAQIQCVVQSPAGGDIPVEQVFRQGDEFRGSFLRTDAAGDYTVKVTATDGTKVLGTASAKFLVYAEDTELRQLAADFSGLKALAEATGGEFDHAENLPKFVRTLKDRDLNLAVSQPIYASLWDRPELLILFVALLTAEWLIRKRSGLV